MADPTYEELIAASKNAAKQGETAAAKTLLDAAVKIYRANPGAVQKPGPFGGAISGMGTRYKDVPKGDNFMTPILDALALGQRGMSFGQSGNIVGLGAAAMTPFTGGSVSENFSAGKQQQMEAEQQASERMTAGGVPLGMLPEAAGAVVTGAPVYKAIGEAYPAVNSWLGTLLTGGAEGGVYAQGQDQDILSGMLTGAGGAAAGRGVASTLGAVLDRLPSLSVQQNAAVKLQQQGERAGIPPQDFMSTMESELSRLGPDAGLADVEALRPFVKGSLTDMSSTESMANVANMAGSPNRNVSDMATSAWESLFPMPRTKNARGQDVKLTLDTAKAMYESGLNNAKVRFRAAPFERMVDTIFGARPTGNVKTVKDAVYGYIADKTPLGPDGKTRLPMTARDLLEVKDAVDAKIKEVARTSADSKTNRKLFDLSAKLNTELKNYVPEVRQAADVYSGQYADDAAFESGYSAGSKGLQQESLADFREMVAVLSPAQKAAFSEGWRKAKVDAADAKGVEQQFKKVGPTKSGADLEIIETIFGPGTGEKFANVSRQLTEIDKTNKQLGAQWRGVSEAAAKPKGQALSGVRQVADALTLGSQALQNKILGGAFQGAFGREARAVGAQAQAAQGDQILDWATRTGNTPQTADDAMREIEQYLLRAKPAPLPDVLGAQAGRTGAAFERSGRN